MTFRTNFNEVFDFPARSASAAVSLLDPAGRWRGVVRKDEALAALLRRAPALAPADAR